ncbi:TetR/AcrR family transcriptional regulator [Bosea sp. BK604]|uniref:TetR/AcrR family transcriptional regulator n=1 Tax=Bosea sp. BK604 TaxID=2512180 RepID=UPI001048D417|nr:TetR/AcrR family transcriptional regulator [Bosea sp. BK604]
MRQIHESVRRSRGRPQIRSGEDTMCLVVDAADHEFQANGYAGTNIKSVSERAGISTKTLYKLVPTKAELFEAVIRRRIGRFLLDVDDEISDDLDPREALERLLLAFGMLTLTPDTIAINRLVISESERFPEVARAFYQSAIVPVNGVIEGWLTRQKDKGTLRIDDVHIASGMLRGMMIMEPQRTAMMGQRAAPHRDEIALRAKQCAEVFYNGCKM